MISNSHGFIFLHSPKTGGNSIQDALRGYADDEFISDRSHQDGIETFGLRNAQFRKLTKHSGLADYCDVLGASIEMLQTVYNHPKSI